MATSRSDPAAIPNAAAGPRNERRLLIANRGEIALRVLRAAREEGWTAIAVYSEADRGALHVAMADEAWPIGPAPSAESYLNIPHLLEAARRGRATHVHPGYGFLSENPEFARACTEAGLIFVGPPESAIRAMGDKLAAREAAKRAGVPVVPGTPGLAGDPEKTAAWAEDLGYPVLIKAAFGGGGKGMRLCRSREELLAACELTRGEAGRAFGNDLLYLEKAVLNPRHVEIQVLCDAHGHGIFLGERECSIQRRHQKLIEEAPSTAISEETRRMMGAAALRLSLGIGYRNAGTVEFLLSDQGHFYFLEMNTRLQVEHPVTEAVTGIDLVRAQLRIAEGEPLPWKQEDIRLSGWAIECRITAEDPSRGFLPLSGKVLFARAPQGPGVRNDSGFETGSEVPVHYDPMLGKLIAWGADREQARARMLRALAEFVVEGIPTSIPFHRWALKHPAFVEGALHTGFVDEFFRPECLKEPSEEEWLACLAAVTSFRERERPIGGSGLFSGLLASPVAVSPNSPAAPASDPLAPRISPWKRGGGIR
jgi:acetyl-CoA carboxylase biotin carboxylase subunit